MGVSPHIPGWRVGSLPPRSVRSAAVVFLLSTCNHVDFIERLFFLHHASMRIMLGISLTFITGSPTPRRPDPTTLLEDTKMGCGTSNDEKFVTDAVSYDPVTGRNVPDPKPLMVHPITFHLMSFDSYILCKDSTIKIHALL